jgi:hypothetical protein
MPPETKANTPQQPVVANVQQPTPNVPDTSPAAEAKANTPQQPVTANYYCDIMESKYLFWRGYGPDNKPLPPDELCFHNHLASESDPEKIMAIESHKLFGIEFRRMNPDLKIVDPTATRYTSGPVTTASGQPPKVS